MNGASQSADALAVDDANLEDAASTALDEIVGYQVLYLPRPEGVQIEDTVDGELGCVVVGVHRLTGNRYVPDLCRALPGRAQAA